MARRKKTTEPLRGFSKGFMIIVFCLGVLYAVYNYMGKFFYGSALFNIAEIVKAPSCEFIESGSLGRLRGQNIFQADLKSVERKVRAEYPFVDRLRVSRRLPNRILLTAEKRDPFAVVSFNKQDVVVDESGMMIGADLPSRGKLPYLVGIADLAEPANGRPLSGQRVSAGLTILKAVQSNDALQSFPVHSVDLTNLSHIQVNLGAIQVVLERFDIEKKISTLGLLLSDISIASDTIHSVDLRFRDPLVKRK